jgi:plastocyanin domain-containing protein
MSATDWMVIVAGLGAIGWVNWYFFIAPRHAVARVAAPSTGAGPAELRIVVRGGYEPATVRVAAGKPVRLVFDRQETSPCSEEVVFPDFGIRKFLPTDRPTAIDITTPSPGRYEFTCGMSMLHGAVVAE